MINFPVLLLLSTRCQHIFMSAWAISVLSLITKIEQQTSQKICYFKKSLTSMSKQADFSRVIWSAMVRVVKPGSRLANSTILMMHLVESSLNLSHRPRSSWTRWSELEFWTHKNPPQFSILHQSECDTLFASRSVSEPHNTFTFFINQMKKNPFTYCINHAEATQMA